MQPAQRPPPLAPQNLVYWTAYVLTWTLVPLHAQYAQSGHFTFASRLRDAAVSNARFYAVAGGVGVLGLVFLTASGRMALTAIPGFLIAANNAFGLGAGIFLLTFGLAEVPKHVWRKAEHRSHLQWCLSRVGKKAVKLQDARAER